MRSRLDSEKSASQDAYLRCIRLYKRVYLSDPHFQGSDDAIYEAATLYQELAARFGTADFNKEAATLLRFLVKDYGASPFRRDAIKRLATLDPAAAVPGSGSDAAIPRRNLESVPQPEARASAPASSPPATQTTGQTATVRSIRHWSTAEYTRVMIDLEGHPAYQNTRISDPDRIFFDLSNTRLGREVMGRPIAVGDLRLRQIRAAQNKPDLVRVVLDLDGGAACSVSELSDPFRIVIDIHKPGTAVPAVTTVRPPAAVSPEQAPPRVQQPAPRTDRIAGAGGRPEDINGVSVGPPDAPSHRAQQAATVVPPASNDVQAGNHERIRASQQTPQPVVPTEPTAPAQPPPGGITRPITPSTTPMPATTAAPVVKEVPAPVVPAAVASERAAESRAGRSKTTSVVPPPKAASPTSDGDMTLTRVLGLKVARIVIDPGHGGNDTGTIGRNGLVEKDLVLDVARNLKKALEIRLGALVVMTREDDRFVSLEERTAIANQHKADLFLSIHANYSHSRSTSGVETYYLDLARTPAERDVASRENASTLRSVSELQELVRKIVTADKSMESRELAGILQRSLYNGSKKILPKSRNRGVRSAPFVVLVGTEMPAVLVEVAFISNPRDERTLKSGNNQQVLARALMSGVEGYVRSLSTYAAHTLPGSK